jgi:hypothetical protein
LFHRVPLADDDAIDRLRSGGIVILTGNGGRGFAQPCPAHQDRACRVYANRPASCRSFRCKTLRQYERGALSWDNARDVIARVQALEAEVIAQVRRRTGEHMSIAGVMRLVGPYTDPSASPEVRRAWAPVLLPLTALLDRLDRHFLPPRKIDTSGDGVAAGPG